MLWSIWITGSIILFVFEIITPGAFFFACLGIGALVTALFSLFIKGQLFQWVIFSIVSLLSIYAIRPIAKKYFLKGEKKSNVDALIGQKAQITEAVNPPDLGLAKIGGEIWRVEGEEMIDKGVMVVITAVEGTRLKVKKA